MAIKVIGAGFGRTGTLSLKVALEMLGFNKCYHMDEMFENPQHKVFWENASEGKPVDWDALFENYQATVDFPWSCYYHQLIEHYPDAKVVLTVRDPEVWYKSALNTIYRVGRSPGENLLMSLQLPFSSTKRDIFGLFRLIEKDIWHRKFDERFKDKAYALAVFNQHIEEVKRTVPPEQLLVYEVKEGWEPLCRFLGVTIPDRPFPHLNQKTEFTRILKEVSA
ncbi:sulfotransferase family protein [Aerosakkonema funiforme]|uniref:sulfotransferase family protein n=1 Tax=Aerosakkonema funiforme TaxID=1246630 RepID=UPI0035B8ACE2